MTTVLSKIDYAEALAETGFHIIPLTPGAKVPALKDWPNRATRDPVHLRQWWGSWPDANIGIFTGAFGDAGALLVVDVDVKGGALGNETISALEADGHDFPATLEVATPTGGRHLFYSVPTAVKQGAGTLGAGVDTRSRGGFVVAPGSVVAAGAYEIAADREIAPAPPWLIERCGKAQEKPAKSDAPAIVSASGESRAIDYLKAAPLSVQGSSGDETAYKVAARCKDLGVDQATALTLMLEYWNERCSPPWDSPELARKVENAYAYGQSPQGANAPEAHFKSVPQQAPAQQPFEASRIRFTLARDIRPVIDRPALVDDLLSPGALSLWFGPSNVGKSFLTLDLALHIATGREWFGRKTMKGGSLYLGSEGGMEIHNRIQAFANHNRVTLTQLPFAVVTETLSLSGDRNQALAVIELATEASRQMGVPIGLIVVDTLAATLGGGDENSAADMGAFIRSLNLLRDSTRAHIAVIHHVGKNRDKGARGHSSLFAAMDSAFEIDGGQVTVEKQRDMLKDRPFGFTLHTLEIGKRADGRAVTSCAVAPVNQSAVRAFGKQPVPLRSVAGKALAILNDAIRTQGISIPEAPTGCLAIAKSQWTEACETADKSNKLSKGGKDAHERAFRRAVHTLLSARQIGNSKEYIWVAP